MKIGLAKALGIALLALSALVSPRAGRAALTATLTATPASVAYGSTATLRWASTDASYCAIPWGSSATSGSYTTPSLFAPTTYTITCYGPAGASSASVTVATAGAPPAPTVSVSADPPTLPAGSTTTLNWSSTDATSCNTPWGATATAGSHVTEPITYERTFTVTCSGYGGSNAAYVVVRLGAAPATPAAPTVTLAANPASVAYGASTTLTWASTNATACSTPWGSTATAGSYATPALTGTATYTVTCSGAGGTRSASTTVTVAAPPAAPVPTVALAANPASIANGASSVLSWSSTNATACTTPGGSTATSGSWATPALTASATYTVSCNGPGGSQSASATVIVAAAPTDGAPSVSLTANPASASYGGSSMLSWSSTGATACSTPWGSSATSGSYTTPSLFAATTYAVTCYGTGGSKTSAVTVGVAGPPPAPVVTLSADPLSVAYNGTSTLTWSASNATACNTPWGATATAGSHVTPPITYDQSFTVNCSGYGGSSGATVTLRIRKSTPTPAPTVALTASPAAVAYGAQSVLSWASTNATACTTPWGSSATSGSWTTPALLADAGYTVSCSGAGGSASASAGVTVAPPPLSSETDPPIVFNATTSARAGDVVSLQGHNFGDAPRVTLDSAPTVPLEIVNRVADANWLAVQIPAGATQPLTLRVRNATGTSAPVKLNGALPLHLDAIQIVPGGALRVFGRNLLAPGSVPTVLIDGKAAAVDVAQSNEHLLAVTAPAALAATAAATILVDNGNGSGPALLDRRIEVAAAPSSPSGGAADPFALGVGWAAAFADLATRTIDAATDARLAQRVACDGVRDDSPAIQQAIELAANLGGGVVRLPAGRCRAAGGMNLRSQVVVQGAGKDATELVYASNYPVYGVGLDLVGIRNLTLSNAGSAVEGPLLKQGTRVFLQNVRVRLGRSSQMYLDGNRNVVVAGCDFTQTDGISFQGPYTFNDSAGLVFENNTTQWADGAPAFGRVHDSVLHANRFTRDGSAQWRAGTVHAMTIDFAYRVAVVGNSFDVAGGPIVNTVRNDGETIITEGGGAQRTENLGSVGSATATTLTDANNTLVADPFGAGYTPENYGIAIVAGKGAGQTRRMVSYSWPTATVDRAWDVVPDASSRYASFVWGLEKSLIKGNVLSQNPRGIWLYHTAIRDVDVVGNSISEGGGIYLRSYQNLAAKQFQPIYNVLIEANTIRNTTGRWMSYINAVFVNSDARAFGIADIGIEVRNNQLTANWPNAGSQTEEYANTEGFMAMMRIENYGGYESSGVPRLLGTIFNGNSCTNCETAVRLGTGAGGTTVLNTLLFNSAVLWSDWATTGTGEKSSGTVVR